MRKSGLWLARLGGVKDSPWLLCRGIAKGTHKSTKIVGPKIFAVGLARSLGAQRSFWGASSTRVWSVIQFTSQVLPPSSENACSKCGLLVSVFDQMKRTKIDLPSKVSAHRTRLVRL